ncbi:MAG: hypothetical protein WCW25_05275 [Patescibacteria group bacterium]|jgi:DNA polymerase-3 subunit delta'
MKDELEQSGWPLTGNERAGEYLLKSARRGGLSGAYIFCGPADLGKGTAARFFARILLCENLGKTGAKLPCGRCPSCKTGPAHGDLFIVQKEEEKKNISIEQIREFIKMMSLGSFLGDYKVGIIKDADSLSIEAANALLKTLEEPKKKTVIILIVTDLDKILPTIVSRSQTLHFFPVKAGVIQDFLISRHKTGRSAAKNFSRLALGRPALAVKMLMEKDYYEDYLSVAGVFFKMIPAGINERLDITEKLIGKKESAQAAARSAERILNIWEGAARDLILLVTGQADLIRHEVEEKAIKTAGRIYSMERIVNFFELSGKARDYLRANVSPKLVLEEVVINL